MKPPLIPPAPRPVSLKPSTPAVLQTSFGDEQWVNAANLARQRYRVTKDPYYLVSRDSTASYLQIFLVYYQELENYVFG